MPELALGGRDRFETPKTPIPPPELPTITTAKASKPEEDVVYPPEKEAAQPETVSDTTTPG
jgi:hypothetical protein